MEPWTRPIFDVFEQYWAPSHIEAMVRENIIEIAPLAYMRGRTFKDCWIIADEMQNATRSQMKMLCTRIGENTKLVITGDLEQHDRGYEDNGLKHFIKLINAKAKDDSESLIDVVTFVPDEIERHVVVEEIIKLYND
jgi:phosphate starvation-inducible PhoH-like protein